MLSRELDRFALLWHAMQWNLVDHAVPEPSSSQGLHALSWLSPAQVEPKHAKAASADLPSFFQGKHPIPALGAAAPETHWGSDASVRREPELSYSFGSKQPEDQKVVVERLEAVVKAASPAAVETPTFLFGQGKGENGQKRLPARAESSKPSSGQDQPGTQQPEGLGYRAQGMLIFHQ